jgi:hypothetical protein
MPNLQQIFELKKRYAQLKKSEKQTRDYLLKENLENVAITKAFSFSERSIQENFDLPTNKPAIITYFENAESEDVVLLFIDIEGFSKITEKKSNRFITDYLSSYYDQVFPVIYNHGGQIEKLMGDGIICIFGKPFLDVEWSIEFNRAEECAKELINLFKGTDKEIKTALHSGPIMYFKTPDTYYKEYTMIGKPLTELYRLESVARKNSINFYHKSIYDGMNPNTGLGISSFNKDQFKLYGFDVDLKGVNYSRVRYLKI